MNQTVDRLDIAPILGLLPDESQEQPPLACDGYKLSYDQDFGAICLCATEPNSTVMIWVRERDLVRSVRVGRKTFGNRASHRPIENGHVVITLDIVSQWLDTGGYFTRGEAEIELGPSRELLGFRARQSLSTRCFLLFGPFREFEVQRSIECGTYAAR